MPENFRSAFAPSTSRKGCDGLGFRVQGSGFRVQGLGFRLQSLGFTLRVQVPNHKVLGLWVILMVEQVWGSILLLGTWYLES